jgi:hypothetical protein
VTGMPAGKRKHMCNLGTSSGPICFTNETVSMMNALDYSCSPALPMDLLRQGVHSGGLLLCAHRLQIVSRRVCRAGGWRRLSRRLGY